MQELISIILPIYNGEKYLVEAIDSIIQQTWSNWELILINDGSKDHSLEVIQKYKDPRITVVDQVNKGLAATLNIGIQRAKGSFIARQDQDDVSLPLRLEKQVEFLKSNAQVGIVGCHAQIIGLNGKKIGVHRHPANNHELQLFLLHNNPFVHSSVMFRKEVFEKTGYYCTDPLRQPPEDYELFSRIARDWQVANIPEILHIYREVKTSMSRDKANPFLPRILKISAENLAWSCEKSPEDELIKATAEFLNGVKGSWKSSDFSAMRAMLYKIVDQTNSQKQLRNQLKSKIRYLFLKAMVKSWIRP